jgi:hypothetical protein
MSLQARGSNGEDETPVMWPCFIVLPANPRPIKTIKAEPTNEEIAPSLSQEPDVTADTKLLIQVRYEDQSVTVKVRPQKTFASLFKTACNHFKLDKDTSVPLSRPLVARLVADSQPTASGSSKWYRLMGGIR